MRRIYAVFVTVALIFGLLGCSTTHTSIQIVATTAPIYEFTSRICENTGLNVSLLITENVSCLHNYSVQPKQMQLIEKAEVLVLSGAGLESFLSDIISTTGVTIDASKNIDLLCDKSHNDHSSTDHHHEYDPHIWLSPQLAIQMSQNICHALSAIYPNHSKQFETNLSLLITDFTNLTQYAQQQLSTIGCRKLITFHDGFSYMAAAFKLEILRAVEEESGSEASAADLIELAELITAHKLPAVFTEQNGSTSTADIISRETGVNIYQLDMAMSNTDYFGAMYHNVDVLKEALE